MACLLDLSTELLLEIIACLCSHTHHIGERVLWPLSQTCRRLNTCCGHWIFAIYRLRLRASWSQLNNHLTPLDTPATLQHWSIDAFAARLQHFRDKASCVRNLVLEDFRRNDDQNEDEPEIFPDCISLDLVDALNYANKLTSIKVTCARGGKLPLSLWDCMMAKNLTKFSVGHNLTPPPDAQGHMRVHTFQGYLFQEPLLFLDVSPTRSSREYIL
jgi:hypothetical protein